MIAIDKHIKPMLIGAEAEPFEDENYIYELKFDGERCLALLDSDGTELRNKRNKRMLPIFPELAEIHKQVNKPCILDGELLVMKNGKPDFYTVQRRSLMSNAFKIELESKKNPAMFIAFDIIYFDGEYINMRPLLERKERLTGVLSENNKIAISKHVSGMCKPLYDFALEHNLEGVVAKKGDSKYHFDKRTKDWVKIKIMQDEDFVVCGYIYKDKFIASLVLGQYSASKLVYKGHVTLGISRDDFKLVEACERAKKAPFKSYPVGNGNEVAIWLEPKLVCSVKYMMKTAHGGLRQPVFKGLRLDREPEDCIEK